MGKDDHAVIRFSHARGLELAVNFDKADLAVTGDAQTGIVTEGGNLDAVAGCNLEDRFIGEDIDRCAVQGDGSIASIGCGHTKPPYLKPRRAASFTEASRWFPISIPSVALDQE
jgi:hypothetical protein